jgi:hypothetical protein
VAANGNVGINTTAPSNLLSVQSTGGTTSTMDFFSTGNSIKGHIGMFANNFYITSNWFYNGSQNADSTSYAQNAISFDSSGFMSFQTSAAGATSPTERMRITSGGDVTISSTTNPVDASSGAGSFYYNKSDYLVLAVNSGVVLYLNRIGSDGEIQRFRKNGVGVGNISVTSSATTYNTSSDYRLKEDLKPINGLEIVNKINVYDYKWKASDNRMDGVLAHELAEVLPYAVQGIKDGAEMQSVDYSKIVPVMVQAIKELKLKIETLENK